ncbi:substrate-binding periplasmic protein [Miniphocaeibacter massiliensis]|uniref:substrate-binding periplasmic protein n=1 Tax=Miniphocaeibacter massiliensis TaxID=2041841 RepID=UPI000C1B82FE|nr:transporter substrate-binding domain-containing protein [Miniphocaeibacter massiliensis]
MKELIIGADYFPPYQYIDKDGEVKGSDYEFVKSIFDKLDYNIKFIIDDWSIIEKKFINGEIDVAFQVQKTKEREKIAFFSKKFRDAKTGIVTNNEILYKTIKKIEDIFNLEYFLGIIEGYKYGDVIDKIDKNYKKYYSDSDELLKYLNSAEARLAVFDIGVLNNIKDNIDRDIFVIDGLTFKRELFVMFKEEEVRDEFNKLIDK